MLACEECDFLHSGIRLPPGTSARCRRCGAQLARNSSGSLDRPLTLALAALVVFLVANTNQIVLFDVGGQIVSSTWVQAAGRLWSQGMWILALLVVATTIAFPFVELASMCYVLAPLRNRFIPPGFARILRLIQALRPWGMLEVFMLGSLVSVAKLSKVATVVPGIGLWSFGALIVVAAGAAMSFDCEDLWRRAEEIDAAAAGRSRLTPAAGS